MKGILGPILSVAIGIIAAAGCNKTDPEHKYDSWNCVGFADGSRGRAWYDQEGNISSFDIRDTNGMSWKCIYRPGHGNECQGALFKGKMDEDLQRRVEQLINTQKSVLYDIDRSIEAGREVEATEETDGGLLK